MEELENQTDPLKDIQINQPGVVPGVSKYKEVPIYTGKPFAFTPPDISNNNSKNVGIFGDFDKIYGNNKRDSVALGSYSNSERYSDGTRPGDNWEEQYAQNQSIFEKARNGILKGVNLAATTVVGGFGMIGGLVQAGIEGDISKVWDNPVSQNLEKWNKYVDSELLPNFYTEKETNADLISLDNLWSANFLFDKVIKNAGFAVGAMLSGNIASGAFRAIGAGIGELAVGGRALTAVEGAMSAELGVAETMKAYSPLLNKIARGFSQAKNIEITKALENYAKLTIGNTVKLTAELAKIGSETAKYANIGGKVGRGIVAAYSSAGESSMEALMGGNALKEKLIGEYINQNGQEPTGADLEAITQRVKSFGKTSFGINMALLGITEYNQLPFLTGSSWKASSNAARKEINEVIAKTVVEGVENTGELIAKTATTRSGKVLAGIKKYGQYVFDPMEGGQEIGQYAVEVGATNYYNKANKNTNAQNWIEAANYGLFGTDETGKGVGALNSKEGLEGGLIGAFTGGLMMAKGTYREQQERNKNTTEFLKEANNAPKIKEVLQHKINSINTLTELQAEQQEAVKNGDISESKNLKSDIMFNYAMHKVRYGKTDMVMADLNDMLVGANDVDTFAGYINEGVANKEDTPETFSARVNELKSFTETLDKTYDDLNVVYGNLTTTNAEGKVERKYTDDALERLSYVQTKLTDYSTRITQLNGQLGSQNVMTFELVDKITKNEKIENFDGEINKLIENSTAQTQTEKSELKKKIEDVLSMTIQQKQFLNEYNDIVDKPENYKINVPEAIVTSISNSTSKEVFTIPTKNGNKEFEIGTEYSILNRRRFNDKGEEVKQPKSFKILSKSEDGTFKIQLDNNDVRDVTEEQLATYETSFISEKENNKKLQFIEAVEDTYFYHAGIKDSNNKAVKGKLEYNNTGDKLQFVYVNESGEVKRVAVDKKFLEPKKGYNQAMISPVNNLAQDESAALLNYLSEQQTKEQVTNNKSDKINTRNSIIKNLYNETLVKLEIINNKLEKVSNSLQSQKEKFEKELQEESVTKKGSPRKLQTKKMIQLIKTITDLEQELTDDIISYQSSKENIQAEIAYLEVFIDELKTNEITGNTLVNSIKEDIDKLNKLIVSTEASIEENKNLLTKVQDFIKKLLESFNEYIDKIKTANPNIPLGIESVQKQLFNSLGINGVTYFKANKALIYNEALDMDSDIQLFEEDLIIPKNNKATKEIIDIVDNLQKQLKETETERNVKVNIINSFEKHLENIEKEKEVLQKTNTIVELTATHDTTSIPSENTENTQLSFEKEDLKTDYQVLNSGIPNEGKNNVPYIQRYRGFTFRYLTLPEDVKKQLRVVTVTNTTQKLIGIENLVSEFLYDVENSSDLIKYTNESIAYVVVRLKEDGSFAPVNEFGEFLSKEELEVPEKHFIAQMMPGDTLINGTQFRDNKNPTEQRKAEVKQLTNQHKNNRKRILNNKDASDNPVLETPTRFTVSLGKPVIRNKEQSSSPLEANLITKEQLETKQVISVVKEGKNKGIVTLNIDDKTIALNNRKLESEEVDAVYDAVKIMSEELIKTGTLKENQKVSNIVNWLKTVVYWGLNEKSKKTVYFKMVEENNKKVIKLFIGENSYLFTPTTLLENESLIKDNISNLYHNINSFELNKLSEYTQIEGFKNDELILKIWNNYQEYLIASKNPVLTTNYFATTSEDVPNREFIYITAITDSEGISQPKEKTVANNNSEGKKVILDNVEYTENTPFDYTTKYGVINGSIVFVEETNNYSFKPSDEKVNEETIGKVVDYFKSISEDFKNLDENTQNSQASGALAKNIIDAFNTEEVKEQVKPEIKIKQTTETKTINNIEDKKADIETRRQEELFGNLTDLNFEVTTKQGKIRKTIVKTKIDENGFTYSFETTIDGTSSSTNFPKVTIQEFKNSTIYENLDQESKDFFEDLEDDTIVFFQDISISTNKNSAAGLGSGRITISISSKSAEYGRLSDIILKYQPNKINAEYDAELAELEKENTKSEVVINKAEKAEESTEELTQEQIAERRKEIKKTGGRKGNFRVVSKKSRNIVLENFDKVAEDIKKMLPNFSVFRTRNIIEATNGRQAYGMFHNAAIYLYEKAEQGTAYHEVFEAVWAMTTNETERKSIIRDFRNRKGSFTEYGTGKIINYNEATEFELKEELAEEFRKYILFDKYKVIKTNNSTNLLSKIFKEILDTLKAFFIGKDSVLNTEELFKRIGNGYYAKHIPQENKLSIANVGIQNIDSVVADNNSQFRIIENITSLEVNQIMQDMTYYAITDMMQGTNNIFDFITPKTSKEVKAMYDKLKDQVLDISISSLIEDEEELLKEFPENKDIKKNIENYVSLYNNVRNQWDSISKRHIQYLAQYNLKIDDELLLEESERGKDDTYADKGKEDVFKNMNAIVRLSLATVQKQELVDGEYLPEINSTGGFNLLPVGQVYGNLIGALNNSLDFTDFIEKFRQFVIDKPEYSVLFSRIFKIDAKAVAIDDFTDKPIFNYDNMSKDDIRLLQSYYTSFTKQIPDVKAQYNLENGDIQIGEGNLSQVTFETRMEFIENIKNTVLQGTNSFLVKSENGYKATNVSLKYLEDKNLFKVGESERIEKFLDNIGIVFKKETLEKIAYNQDFVTNINYMLQGFGKLAKSDKEIKEITFKENSLNMGGDLFALAQYKTKYENTEFNSVYFNVEGESQQSAMQPNWLSKFSTVLKQVNNKSELSNTVFNYLTKDSFSKNSVILKRLFSEKGVRKDFNKSLTDFLNPIIINGVDNFDDKNKATKSLNKKERLLLEMNNNFAGVYYVLVPGDASTQNAMKMHEAMSSNQKGFVNSFNTEEKFLEILEGYFIDELTLTKEQRIIHAKRNNNELRFFKEILSKELHDKVVNEYKDSEKTTKEVYDDNKIAIDNSLKAFLNSAYKAKFEQLQSFQIIKKSIGADQNKEYNYKINGLSVFKNNEAYKKNQIEEFLKAQTANYMIANIEYHKLVFGDPYLYKDALKRVKNFLSPAQSIPHGNIEIDKRLNTLWNDEQNVEEFKKQSKEKDNKHFSFVTDFAKTSFVTSVISDVKSYNEELGYDVIEDEETKEQIDNSIDETDGQGLITDIAARAIEITNGTWNETKETQFLYDQAFTKLTENKLFNLDYKLTAAEKAQWKKGNPKNQANYTGKKPIVAGNKEMDRDQNDVVLHKYALFNMSYRLIYENNPNANALQLYRNMRRDNIDYVIYESGAKVGVEKVYPLYKVVEKNGQLFGEINTDVFGADDNNEEVNEPKTVIKIPKAIFSIQGIVPTKEKDKTIQASQPTKLVSMDFNNAGVPIDFMPDIEDFEIKYDLFYNKNKSKERTAYDEKEGTLHKIIKSNFDVLKARIEDGLQRSIDKLGITANEDGTYNLSDKTLTVGFLKRQLLTREVNSNILEALEKYENDQLVLEAIPAYQQIRNILYSIANKEISSPNISGRQAAQFSSALFESGLRKIKQKVVNGKTVDLYESDILEFYTNEDGKRTCEIMIPKWFKNPFDTDEELIEYLNNTTEGQKILSGVAYRIPTQKQNSIESFVIKKFLPDEYKDSVIVPSALTKKVGSDFDIDKLFIYFKQVYFDSKTKELKMLPYFGTGKEAKDKIEEAYNKRELDEYVKYKKKLSEEGLKLEKMSDNFMNAVFTNESEATLKKEIINTVYRESLDNEYISTMQELISHPLNFANLVKPNSAKQLIGITEEIDKKKGITPVDFFNVGLMLNQLVMSKYRHDLITGKYNIGIAATGQTGNSQGQKGLITINFDKVSEESKKLFENGGLKFRNYNKVNGKPTISLIKDANSNKEKSNYISDVLGQIIDGFVDISKDNWIMRLGLTKNMAGTFIALVRLGVPARQVAFFMNQPIIDAHLKLLTNLGYSGVSNSTDVTIKTFKSKVKSELEFIPEEKELLETIGKNVSEMSEEEKANQLYIFNEFLKCSKIAEDLLTVTQATNFDTATFNDPDLIGKKVMQLEAAKNTMFEGIEVLLENTHIEELSKSLQGFRQATSTILKSDSAIETNNTSIQKVKAQVLKQYIDLNDRDFVALSKKVVFTLFDWAVQTNTNINSLVKETLLSNAKGISVASKMIVLKNKVIKDTEHLLHNNYVLKLLEIRKGEKEGETDNLYLKALSNKVYDQDYIIESFKELKKYLYDTNQDKLFNDFMTLAVLQSGLTNSKLSFTNLIPLDEFEKKYANTLSIIDTLPNLQEFYDAHIFERTNTRDTNAVKDRKDQDGNSKTNILDANLRQAQKENKIPKLIKLPLLGKDGSKDFITFTQGYGKWLMKKVYKSNGTPLFDEVVYEDNSIKEKYFIYKAINTLGNTIYSKEFYNTTDTTLNPGVINNGYEKIANEVEDSVIENIYETTEKINNFENTNTTDNNNSQLNNTEQNTIIESSETFKEKENNNKLKPINIHYSEYDDLQTNKNKKGYSIFQIRIIDGYSNVFGKSIVIPGYENFEFFIYLSKQDYIISEKTTGFSIGSEKNNSIKKTIENAVQYLKESNRGSELLNIINKSSKIEIISLSNEELGLDKKIESNSFKC